MTLLHAAKLAFQHPAQPQRLFSDVTFDNGDRNGLVGPNGAGKTTLLRLLAHELAPSACELVGRNGLRLAYVPQESQAPAEARNRQRDGGFEASL